EQLAVIGVHRRRAAHADLPPELEMLGDRGTRALGIRNGAAELRARQRRIAVVRAPYLVRLRPRFGVGPGARIEQVTHLDAELVDLLDIAVELPAVAAIDVREDRDPMLALPFRGEHDRLARLDGVEQLDASRGTGRLGHVLEAFEVVDLALDQEAAVRSEVRDVRADRVLIQAFDRGRGDVARADAIQLRGELFLGRLRGLVTEAGRDGQREGQHDPRRLHGFS